MATYSGIIKKRNGTEWDNFLPCTLAENVLLDSDTNVEEKIGTMEQQTNIIKEVVANVKFFGAKGDGIADDTIPIQNALNSGKPTYFPKGTYKITSQLLCTNQTLYGDNSLSSILMWDSSASTTGIIVTVTKNGMWSNQAYIHNLSLRTNKYNSGTALTIKAPSTLDERFTSKAIIENLTILPARHPNESGWSIGIILDAVIGAKINDTIIIGNCDVDSNMTGDSGIRIVNTTNGVPHPAVTEMHHIGMWGFTRGIYGDDFEGLEISDSNIGAVYGLYIATKDHFPHLSVIGVHINATHTSIVLRNVYETFISNCLLYSENSLTNSCMVDADGSVSFLTINNNMFENRNENFGSNCLIIGANRSIISNNIFRQINSIPDASHKGIGLWLTPESKYNLVSNNLFNGTETPILNQGTNNEISGSLIYVE